MQNFFKTECPEGALNSIKSEKGVSFIGDCGLIAGETATLVWGQGEDAYRVDFIELTNMPGHVMVRIGKTETLHTRVAAADHYKRLLNAGYHKV